MEERSEQKQGFILKNRRPAYLAAALIVIALLVIYLINVYHNKHENQTPLPPKTMTKPEE